MQRIATAAGPHARTGAALLTLVLGVWAVNACAQTHGSLQGKDTGLPALLPAEIHGVWDLAPEPCYVDPTVESDSRLQIGADFVRGYEELMEIREVARISDIPLALRVLAVSDIAPPDLQGPAIYVLSGDSLTIADAEQARSYVRCRSASSGRDGS